MSAARARRRRTAARPVPVLPLKMPSDGKGRRGRTGGSEDGDGNGAYATRPWTGLGPLAPAATPAAAPNPLERFDVYVNRILTFRAVPKADVAAIADYYARFLGHTVRTLDVAPATPQPPATFRPAP